MAGRRNRSIVDCERTLMMEKSVSQKYWKENESWIEAMNEEIK